MMALPTTKMVTVWPSPQESANQGSTFQVALLANDGGNGDNVVGIGGMAHPKHESDDDNGEQPDHFA